MPRRLTRRNIDALVEGIGALAEPTWKEVVKLAKRRLRHGYSRQALSSHEEIGAALAARKQEVRRNHEIRHPQARKETRTALLARVESLDAELARLAGHNEIMEGQFAIWAYNARVLGIPDHRLKAPLQPVQRDYSEGDA